MKLFNLFIAKNMNPHDNNDSIEHELDINNYKCYQLIVKMKVKNISS